MKIIDENGMLFGRLNIIDFMVILFLISFIPVLYLGYKLTTRDIDTKVRQVSIQVNFQEIIPELAKVIKVGDVDKDSFGKVAGRLSDISEARPSEITVLRMEDEVITKVSNSKKDMSGRFDIVCKEKNAGIYYKDQIIKIGKEFTFSTDIYVITGKIVDIKTAG